MPNFMNPSHRVVFSLYRSYLRQIRRLPHSYLCHFFRIKARDDIQKILSFRGKSLIERNMKFVNKAIRKFDRANKGDAAAFQHVLDLAYGRKGKLKWELLDPFLHPEGPLPMPIIPGLEKSRPPVVSPQLQALLTSAHSRTTKALDKAFATTPRNLPARADPTSEDARIYGPFSKRREVNIRRRSFKTETKKVLPPLEVHAYEPGQAYKGTNQVQILPATRHLDSIIGDVFTGPTKTRKERLSQVADAQQTLSSERHPSRWVRRRYRALLTRVPRLVEGDADKFTVHPSPRSFAPHQKTAAYMPEADSATLAWIEKSVHGKHVVKSMLRK